MNLLVQETNTLIKFVPSTKIQRSRYETTAYEQTVGGHFSERFIPVSNGLSLFSKAWRLAYSLDDDQLADEVKNFLHLLQGIMLRSLPRHLEYGLIPQLGAHLVEDGSVLLEWIFKNYRIGFSIERDPDESSWFLATDAYLGNIGASGILQRSDLSALLHWLLSFIGSHV